MPRTVSSTPLSVKSNMLWNSMGSLCNLGCQWLITVLIVRLSEGYESAGVYSLAMSVYGIFSPLAQYRTYTYQVSDVKGENTAGEYLAFRGVTCGLALVLTMAYAAATCRPAVLPAIFLFTLYKLAALVIDVLHASDQQARRMDYVGRSLALQGFCSLLLFVGAYTLSHSLELTIFLMLIATILIGLAYDYPRASALVRIEAKISLAKVRFLIVRCAPVVIAGMACSAAPSIPRQYLSSVMGDAALGVYASVAAPVAIIQMGASYIYNPLLGYYSKSFADRDAKTFRRLIFLTFAGIAVVGAICSVGLELFGGRLLSLVYGEGIVKHLYLLQPLVFCAIVTGVMWFVNDLLISLRNFRSTLVGSIVALAISLLVMVPAIESFGMNGVTIASVSACLVSTAFMLVCLFIQMRACLEGGGIKVDDR